jgi:hypothetical protein
VSALKLISLCFFIKSHMVEGDTPTPYAIARNDIFFLIAISVSLFRNSCCLLNKFEYSSFIEINLSFIFLDLLDFMDIHRIVYILVNVNKKHSVTRKRTMNKFKLNDFQLNCINDRLLYANKNTENYLLETYGVYSLEDLPSTEYNEIIDSIEEYNKAKETKTSIQRS